MFVGQQIFSRLGENFFGSLETQLINKSTVSQKSLFVNSFIFFFGCTKTVSGLLYRYHLTFLKRFI